MIINFSDEGEDCTNIVKVLKEMNLYDICSEEDVSLIKEVCELVSQRGAYIVATGIDKVDILIPAFIFSCLCGASVALRVFILHTNVLFHMHVFL